MKIVQVIGFVAILTSLMTQVSIAHTGHGMDAIMSHHNLETAFGLLFFLFLLRIFARHKHR